MADTYAQEFWTLASAFASAWGNETRIVWPNKLPTPDIEATEKWVRFTVIPGEGAQRSFGAPGANLIRYVGVVDIAIFIPLNTSITPLNALADRAVQILDSFDFPGWKFGRAYRANLTQSVAQNASNVSNQWYRANVRITYERDSFK